MFIQVIPLSVQYQKRQEGRGDVGGFPGWLTRDGNPDSCALIPILHLPWTLTPQWPPEIGKRKKTIKIKWVVLISINLKDLHLKACKIFLKYSFSSPWRAPGSSPVFDACGIAGWRHFSWSPWLHFLGGTNTWGHHGAQYRCSIFQTVIFCTSSHQCGFILP